MQHHSSRRDMHIEEAIGEHEGVLQCVAVCCSVLQCGAVWCNLLQCVAVCCSVLQCVVVCCILWRLRLNMGKNFKLNAYTCIYIYTCVCVHYEKETSLNEKAFSSLP